MMKISQKMAILAVFGGLLLASCASSSKGNGPYRTIPEKGSRPEWTYRLSSGASNSALAFRGISGREVNEQLAQNGAQNNGRQQLVQYYGTAVASFMEELTATYGLVGDTLNPQIAGDTFLREVANNLAQQLFPSEYYTEVYLDGNNRDAFLTYVLMTIPTSTADKAISDYGKQQADKLRAEAQAAATAELKEQFEQSARIFDNLPDRIQNFLGN
jgi:hypothetical protein